MINCENESILKRIQQWKSSDIVMNRLKRDELHHIRIDQVIEAMDDAFESALIHFPMRMTSGLVDQQAWFSRMPR